MKYHNIWRMRLFKTQRSKFWTLPLYWMNVLWINPVYLAFLVSKRDFVFIRPGDGKREKGKKHLVTNIITFLEKYIWDKGGIFPQEVKQNVWPSLLATIFDLLWIIFFPAKDLRSSQHWLRRIWKPFGLHFPCCHRMAVSPHMPALKEALLHQSAESWFAQLEKLVD